MHPGGQRGFTLTELVIILVLISVLAVIALPRLNIEGFERHAFSSELINALRYAQKTAIGSGCHVQATVNAATDSYSLTYTGTGGAACGSGGTAVSHPTRSGAFAGNGEIDSGGSVVFDSMGGTTSALNITLASGTTITVEPVTGYVHD